MSKQLKVNDCVIVVNDGKRYTGYQSMVKAMGLTRFKSSNCWADYTSRLGRIVSLKKHSDKPSILLCGVDIGDEDIIMGISGLKRFPRIKYELLKKESNVKHI